MEQQSLILEELTRQKVGTVQEVLIEEYDSGREQFAGRTAADAPEIDCRVYFTARQGEIGSFVPVKITGTEGPDLVGEAL